MAQISQGHRWWFREHVVNQALMIGERFESPGRWNWSFIQLCKDVPSLKQTECVVSQNPSEGPGWWWPGPAQVLANSWRIITPALEPRSWLQREERKCYSRWVYSSITLSFFSWPLYSFLGHGEGVGAYPSCIWVEAGYNWMIRQWFDILSYTVLYIDVLQLYFYAVFYRSSHASCIVYGF